MVMDFENGQDMEMTVDLKKRSDIHWARKVWHVLAVGFMAVFYAYAPLKLSLILLVIACAIFISVDFLRQKNAALNDFIMHVFKPIMRDSEISRLAGTTYLIVGVTLVAFIFPREITLLTLLFLAFADPSASYFGIRYGKDKIFGDKSIQGSLAAFVVCALLTAIFLSAHSMILDRVVIVSLLGGLIGALAELIPIFDLDDNFTLPVLSASALWVVFTLFGALSV